MGGILNMKDRLPIGVSEADMIASDFTRENSELRRVLADLINNKPSSKKYKEAYKIAVDLLSKEPINRYSWMKKPETKWEEKGEDENEIRADLKILFDCWDGLFNKSKK